VTKCDVPIADPVPAPSSLTSVVASFNEFAAPTLPSLLTSHLLSAYSDDHLPKYSQAELDAAVAEVRAQVQAVAQAQRDAQALEDCKLQQLVDANTQLQIQLEQKQAVIAKADGEIAIHKTQSRALTHKLQVGRKLVSLSSKCQSYLV
jgi:hypothetical protein